MILKAIHLLLTQHTGTTRLTDDRVYPFALPQNSEIPAIDMRAFGEGLDGQTLTQASNCFRNEVILDCYGDDPGTSYEIAIEAINALSNFRGLAKGVFVHELLTNGAITQDSDGVTPGTDDRRFVSTVSFDATWSL